MKKGTKRVSYAKYGYIFSIPFVVAFAIFTLYPTIYTVMLGFTDCMGFGKTDYNFLRGDLLENFKLVINNRSFIISLKNTIAIWTMNFIPQMFISLLLTAWFTSHSVEIKGKGFFKVIFYMPNIITSASVAMLFNSLFAYPLGPVNDFLVSTGILKEVYNFSIDKTACRVIVAFIQFLQWYGNTTIVLIAGVMGISSDIFEAAQIDGANGVQTFFKITLPNIRTILLFTLITSLDGGLNMFDVPLTFSGGGPDNATLTLSIFIYNQAFSGSYMYNRAAAASMMMWVVIAASSLLLFYILRDKDEAMLEKEVKMLRKQEREKT